MLLSLSVPREVTIARRLCQTEKAKGPVAQRLEQGTHNLRQGILAVFQYACMPLYFQRFSKLASKPVQAHLDPYPLHYPLQSRKAFFLADPRSPPCRPPRLRVTYPGLAIFAKRSINYLVNVINKNVSNQPE
jgi:hypothetical protein